VTLWTCYSALQIVVLSSLLLRTLSNSTNASTDERVKRKYHSGVDTAMDLRRRGFRSRCVRHKSVLSRCTARPLQCSQIPYADCSGVLVEHMQQLLRCNFCENRLDSQITDTTRTHLICTQKLKGSSLFYSTETSMKGTIGPGRHMLAYLLSYVIMVSPASA